MNEFAQFIPIQLDNRDDVLNYYSENNIDIPDNPYFIEEFKVPSEDLVTKKVETPPNIVPDKKYVPKVLLDYSKPEVNKIKFINDNWQDASEASKVSGVPTETILAMSALETGYGKHMPGNMVAGIKKHNYSGKSLNLKTKEFVNGKMVEMEQPFRSYDTTKEAFMDFGKFLLENSRYKQALNVKDPFKAAEIIARSGYATDPKYEFKLKSILKRIIENKITPPKSR